MGKIKLFLIFVLIILAFGFGVYFSKDVNKQIEDFEKSDVGKTFTQIAKKIIAPNPLNIGGEEKNVILLQSKIISETNLQRKANGLSALKENTKLDQAASAKANDMFKNQYFEHISPLGVGPGDLAQSYGYDYIIEGENLILGNFSSEKEVVQSWMDSPGHRANILNDRYTEIGVAIVKGAYKGQTVWIGVQEFGLPLSNCTQPNSALKNQIDLDKMQMDVLFLQIDEKREQINNINPHNPAYRQIVDDYNKLVDGYNFFAAQVKEEIANYNTQVNNFNNCVSG